MIKYGPLVPAKRDFEANPITPDDIVKYARTWLGARWKHQGRGYGPRGYIDCAGLMQRVMEEFGMPYQDVTGYGRAPEPEFLKHIEKLTLKGDLTGNYHGALAVFNDGSMPCHVGILATDKKQTTVIHSEAFPRMRTYECSIHEGHPTMFSRLVTIRWFPGVKYV